MTRERLPNRRASESRSFRWKGMYLVATISRFPDGRLAEIFLTNGKVGSDTESAARDCAVVASLALQYGAPVETLRHALLRDAHGAASSPLGAALDLIAGDGA
jgi:hypothetical protein